MVATAPVTAPPTVPERATPDPVTTVLRTAGAEPLDSPPYTLRRELAALRDAMDPAAYDAALGRAFESLAASGSLPVAMRLMEVQPIPDAVGRETLVALKPAVLDHVADILATNERWCHSRAADLVRNFGREYDASKTPETAIGGEELAVHVMRGLSRTGESSVGHAGPNRVVDTIETIFAPSEIPRLWGTDSPLIVAMAETVVTADARTSGGAAFDALRRHIGPPEQYRPPERDALSVHAREASADDPTLAVERFERALAAAGPLALRWGRATGLRAETETVALAILDASGYGDRETWQSGIEQVQTLARRAGLTLEERSEIFLSAAERAVRVQHDDFADGLLLAAGATAEVAVERLGTGARAEAYREGAADRIRNIIDGVYHDDGSAPATWPEVRMAVSVSTVHGVRREELIDIACSVALAGSSAADVQEVFRDFGLDPAAVRVAMVRTACSFFEYGSSETGVAVAAAMSGDPEAIAEVAETTARTFVRGSIAIADYREIVDALGAIAGDTAHGAEARFHAALSERFTARARQPSGNAAWALASDIESATAAAPEFRVSDVPGIAPALRAAFLTLLETGEGARALAVHGALERPPPQTAIDAAAAKGLAAMIRDHQVYPTDPAEHDPSRVGPYVSLCGPSILRAAEPAAAIFARLRREPELARNYPELTATR